MVKSRFYHGGNLDVLHLKFTSLLLTQFNQDILGRLHKDKFLWTLPQSMVDVRPHVESTAISVSQLVFWRNTLHTDTTPINLQRQDIRAAVTLCKEENPLMDSPPRSNSGPWAAAIIAVPLVALFLHILMMSPISPDPLLLPPSPNREGPYAVNTVLQSAEKLGEGIVDRPEDVAVDAQGVIYVTTQDGWIKRMHGNGSWENWKTIGGTPLGLTVAKGGEVLVCEPTQGLLSVGDEEISVLASEIEGTKIRFADAVVEATDGTVYFSDMSTEFGYEQWELDVLEAKPHGRLLKYDPKTGTTSILLDKLAFANGVALSSDQDFLVVCETWKFRCLKHWLKGDKTGETEVFIDNLPLGPDNVHLAGDGSFWIALIPIRSGKLEFVYRHPFLKRAFAEYPKLLKWVGLLQRRAMVLKVGEDGRPIRSLEDPDGKVLSFVTSAMESGDYLYLGNLGTNFLGRLHLSKVTL